MRKFFAPLLLLFIILSASSVPRAKTISGGAQPGEAAKSDAKVWINTKSGVYHCPGTRWYGKTKQGEYLTETQARDKGFRPAYGKPCGPIEERATTSSGAQTERKGEIGAPGQAANPDTKVWVNTKSAVYHCPGTRWYGNTKNGEYLTQKQAQEKGNRPAYGKPCQ